MTEPAAAAQASFLPGQRFGLYELLVAIGQSPRSALWIARARKEGTADRLFALRTLLPDDDQDDGRRRRFLDEARIASSWEHPNLIRLYDAGDRAGVYFVVSDWIEGGSLAALFDGIVRTRTKLPLRVLVRIIVDACAGLHAAHETSVRPFLHGHLSLKSVLIDNHGRTRVGGVGLPTWARRLLWSPEGDAAVSPCPAPEQALGLAVDRTTDVWRLGALLLRMITGRYPFAGAVTPEDRRRLTSGELPDLPAGLPPELDAVLRRAMAFAPHDRFASTSDLASALSLVEAPAEHFQVAQLVGDLLGERTLGRLRDVADTSRRLESVSRVRVGLRSLTSAEPPDDLLGKTVGDRYLVERRIGAGAIGAVYAGRHQAIGKQVAIRVVASALAGSDTVASFARDARAVSRIESPHIVRTHDVGELPDGRPYFVMDLVEGETLREVLRRHEPFAPSTVLSIGTQTAQALAAAHDADIVHRDLKPASIFLRTRGVTGPFVKVSDFGVCQMGRSDAPATLAGAVFGTATYMAPEQAIGTQVDARADIYALGIILYEMIAGAPPFSGETPMEVLSKHLDAAVPALPEGSIADRMPGMEALLVKALAKKPENRHATVGGFLGDLADVERATVAREDPPLPAKKPALGRAPILALTLATAALLAAAGYWVSGRPAPSSVLVQSGPSLPSVVLDEDVTPAASASVSASAAAEAPPAPDPPRVAPTKKTSPSSRRMPTGDVVDPWAQARK